jgi:hypothetical protein
VGSVLNQVVSGKKEGGGGGRGRDFEGGDLVWKSVVESFGEVVLSLEWRDGCGGVEGK